LGGRLRQVWFPSQGWFQGDRRAGRVKRTLARCLDHVFIATEHKDFEMSQDHRTPSPESLQSLLETIAPGSKFVAIHSLEGDFSNSTHLVDCKTSNGSSFQVVTRQYAIFGDYDRGEKARREFKTLQLLKNHGSPVPEPLYLDDTGTILGSPGIVTRYMPGKLIMAQPYPMTCLDFYLFNKQT
jgi:hypothetical protein